MTRPPGIEPGTSRAKGGYSNHCTTQAGNMLMFLVIVEDCMAAVQIRAVSQEYYDC